MTGFGERMEHALDTYERRQGVRKVSDETFAGVLREALGNPKLSASTVSRWRKGRIPDVQTIATIARVCGVNPGWLAFGPLAGLPLSGDHVEAAPVPRSGDTRKAGRG